MASLASRGPKSADKKPSIELGTKGQQYEPQKELGRGNFGVAFLVTLRANASCARCRCTARRREPPAARPARRAPSRLCSRALSAVQRPHAQPAALSPRLCSRARFSRPRRTALVMKCIELDHMDDEAKAKAQNECKVLTELAGGPYIVGVVEYFVELERLWIVMDFADGGDLAARIKAQKAAGVPFTEDEVVDWIVQLVLALSHAHERKVLHRDLKPQNIFLMRDGAVRLGDFGISRSLSSTLSVVNTCVARGPYRPSSRAPLPASSGLQNRLARRQRAAASRARARPSPPQLRVRLPRHMGGRARPPLRRCVGTPMYLSPETWNGSGYDDKSDAWSLGVLLYELCALRTPVRTVRTAGLVSHPKDRGAASRRLCRTH